jgi:chitinase
LEQQYATTLQSYGTSGIDLDIEGAALLKEAAINRDALALRALEVARAAQHKSTTLWLTLPVTTTGFDANGQSVLTAFLRDRVAIAGVNALTMDFGVPVQSMSSAIESALRGVHTQLQTAFRQYGIRESARQVWNHMGATFMIGQNDSAGEVVTTADAKVVEGYAATTRLRRLSFWSLNRDAPCGSVFGQVAVLSNTCSGVTQASLQFSKTFAALTGRLFTSSGPQRPVVVAARGSTNPKNFPYPLWQPNIPYPQGYKVVWSGNVYEARYYTQGIAPSTTVQYQYQSPWLLLGPVLRTDRAPTTTTLPTGEYPSWSPKAAYTQGQVVDYDGLPYRARYYSVGSSPGNEVSNPTGSPWLPLFQTPGEPSIPIS